MSRRAKPTEDPMQLQLFVPTSLVRIGPDEWRVVAGKPSVWLSPAQVAKELGVSRNTIYDWIGSVIPDELCVRVGPRLIRISAEVMPRLRTRMDA